MLLIDKLKLVRLSPNEEIARDYILEQGKNLYIKTLKTCSVESFVSTTTFFRLAKKLDFDGWSQFKAEYLLELRYLSDINNNINPNTPFTKDSSLKEVFTNISQLKISAITETLEQLDMEKAAIIVDLIDKASEVVIFANSINVYQAKDFYMKMNRIGHRVILSDIPGEMLHDAQNIPKDGIALFISYSGYYERLNEILLILKQRNIKIIAVTHVGENTLSKNAHYHLSISTRERLFLKIANFTSNTSIMHVLDMLYSGIFSLDFENNISHMVYTEKNFSRRHSDNSILNE